jgi:hypothetical protein
MAQLLLYYLLARQQAQLGAVEARTKELIDRALKIVRSAENSNSFTYGMSLKQHRDWLRNVERVRP